MITYSMSQVETLTGIGAHALRVWERRYNFIHPQRTASNIRYYTDSQLKMLLNISILTRNGYKISKIDKMSQTEMFEKVTDILLAYSEENSDRINGLVLSMIELDENTFNNIFEKAVADTNMVTTMVDLIYPFLKLVGGLWITNKAIPAQEHFISNLIRQKIIANIEALPQSPEGAKKILFFLLENESHEVSLLISTYIAKSLGWKTIYLGQNVPSKNIGQICDLVNPDLMMTMFVVPKRDKVTTLLTKIIKDTNRPLLFSGNPNNFEDLVPVNNTIYIKHPFDLEEHLKRFA